MINNYMYISLRIWGIAKKLKVRQAQHKIK